MNREIRHMFSEFSGEPRCHATHGAAGHGAPQVRRVFRGKTAGLTLIELLVVIIILVTLVAGVLPLLSPNNENNKIQAASRSLQTYLQKAQTKAMRTGRSVGVMFRESQPGDGYALEAYQVEIPREFTGFSSTATARFQPKSEREDGGGYVFKGSYKIQFGEGHGNAFVPAPRMPGVIPPRMVRVGDLIEVGDSVFRIEFESQREIDWDFSDESGELYFNPTSQFSRVVLVSGPSPPTAPITANEFTFPKSFAIARQPVINSEMPLTLPKGVALDMTASGTEGGSLTTLFAGNTGTNNLKQIGIMFSPAGGIEDVYYNGSTVVNDNGQLKPLGISTTPISNVGQVMLLLAMVEKSGLSLTADTNERPWMMSGQASKEEVEESRDKVSWLSADSRWVTIRGRSNLIKVAKNSVVDPRNVEGGGNDSGFEAFDQIQAARGQNTLYVNDRVATLQ